VGVRRGGVSRGELGSEIAWGDEEIKEGGRDADRSGIHPTCDLNNTVCCCLSPLLSCR
jgi:hypothetical protein